MLKPRQSQCRVCEGAGGYYWDAPVYHNERVREWATCHNCVHDDGYARYLIQAAPEAQADDEAGR